MNKNRIKIILLILMIITMTLLITFCEEEYDFEKDIEQVDFSQKCHQCHTGKTELGSQLKYARNGVDNSSHKNGMKSPLRNSEGKIIAYEWEGSNAPYSNAGGCQVCHTNEGFLKVVNGSYKSYQEKINDVIMNPTTIDCFTCHSPHIKGNFDLVVKSGTPIKTQTSAEYNKPKGSLCAQCHQVELSGIKSVNAYILNSVINGDLKYNTSYWGPHHGPQTDMLMGKGGATYNSKIYENSNHTEEMEANCVSCHMPSPDKRWGLSYNVGGHSFNVSGIVHGSLKTNTAGCIECHNENENNELTVRHIGDFDSIKPDGYLEEGDIYYEVKQIKTTSVSKLDRALRIFADPNDGCNGLLQRVFNLITGGNIRWSYNKPCTFNGFDMNLPANPNAIDTSKETRFAKALWNFKFVYNEDGSFGVHNLDYSLFLLKESCLDLKDLLENGFGVYSNIDCSIITND